MFSFMHVFLLVDAAELDVQYKWEDLFAYNSWPGLQHAFVSLGSFPEQLLNMMRSYKKLPVHLEMHQMKVLGTTCLARILSP